MEMERKYQIPFNYKGVGKLIFATNHPIRTVSDDKAFYERMYLIPFMNSVPENRRDLKLLNRLLREKDAIVTKALQAAMELYDNGFQLPKLESAERIKWAWAKSVPETVNCFLRDCCEETEDEQVFESTTKLIKAYREYCKENDYIPGNMKAFSSQLKEYFDYCVRDLPSYDGKRHQARGFIGICLQ